jgi:hypothetical protein
MKTKNKKELNDHALDYFPPVGTKYFWWCKQLNHRPHLCRIEPLEDYHTRQYALLSCSYYNGGWYKATVEFFSLDKSIKTVSTRYYKTELAACCKAEQIAEKLLADDTPAWAKEALKAGWREPC